MRTRNIVPRRDFLKHAAQTAAALVVCHSIPTIAAGAEGPAQSGGKMPIRTLGNAGLKLPILGYGGAALPKAWLNLL